MGARLGIAVCENLRLEAEAAVKAEGLADVEVLSFRAGCTSARLPWEAIAKSIAEQGKSLFRVDLIASACCAGPPNSANPVEGCRVLRVEQCHHLLVPRMVAEAYQKDGAYLLTSGWLARWRHYMHEWSFDGDTAREFFKESASRLVLLDTGVDQRSPDHLRDLAAFLDLPFQIVPVGLDLFQVFLAKMALEARLEYERSRVTDASDRANRQVADHAMALDLASSLAGIKTESEAIEGILDLFTTLFAPRSLVYVPLNGRRTGEVYSRPTSSRVEEERKNSLAVFQGEYSFTESGDGFLIRVEHHGEGLGILQVDRVAFPEYRDRYLNLALSIGRVCGLVISNARTYEQIRVAQDTLAAERERLAVTLGSIGDGVVATDTEGRVVLLNRVAEDLTGWTQEEASGRVLEEVFHIVNEKTREACENPVKKVLDTGTIAGLANDTALIARDGRETLIADSAAPVRDRLGETIGVVLVFRDVTELKQADEKLRQLSQAVEQSPSTVIITDTGGAIQYANPKFIQTSGYTLEEAVGQNPRILKSGEMSPEQYNDLWETITSGREWRGEFHNKKKNGELYWEFASISPIRDGEGRVTHYLAVKEDITGRKLVEEEREGARQLAEEMAREADRRAAELDAVNKELEAFAYSVSHDLRAPLRTIDGFSQALLEDCADKLGPEGQNHLRRVRGASQRMGQLIDDMLRLSRVTRSEMRPEPVDLSVLARDIIRELQKAQPERQVEFTIAPGLIAHGDARLLRIMMENLLSNAWKFTGTRPRAVIEFGVSQLQGKPAYFVRDDGVGFDSAFRNKLFEAFERLHNSTEFPGTGIGLATVQRIVRRHGGRVWAEGTVGQGATFYFTF